MRQANAAARRSFAAPEPPVPLVRVLRDPGVLAAVTGALAGTTASSVTFSPTHDRAKQFSARIEPVDLGDGGQGLLLAFREQTEQVMIERMRSDFVANASHEIRTPLASIQGFIETLRGPAKHDPKARETFLEIMGEEAARMARLVDDLLSLSRIELAAHQPPRERCDPRDALLYAIDRLRPVADEEPGPARGRHSRRRCRRSRVTSISCISCSSILSTTRSSMAARETRCRSGLRPWPRRRPRRGRLPAAPPCGSTSPIRGRASPGSICRG